MPIPEYILSGTAAYTKIFDVTAGTDETQGRASAGPRRRAGAGPAERKGPRDSCGPLPWQIELTGSLQAGGKLNWRSK
jgi:hypothetical protein